MLAEQKDKRPPTEKSAESKRSSSTKSKIGLKGLKKAWSASAAAGSGSGSGSGSGVSGNATATTTSNGKHAVEAEGSEEDEEDVEIEIAPMVVGVCEHISKLVKAQGGAAVFIDYGENYTQADTLRGYKDHKQLNILSQPGLMDVTADVDFDVCSRTLQTQGLNVQPLLTQQEFLLRLGIYERVEALLESPSTTEEQAESIVSGYEALLGSDAMGKRFKVLMSSHPSIDLAHALALPSSTPTPSSSQSSS